MAGASEMGRRKWGSAGGSCSKTVCKTTMFESLALDQKKAIAVVCAAVLLLDDEPERPNKPRVGQEVLPSDPKTESMSESTWATSWANGDGRTLVKLINLDRPAFLKLLPSFESEFRLRDTAGDLLHRPGARFPETGT